MENYICINGQQTELTAEQLKQLGIEIKPKYKTPFDRVELYKKYFYIDNDNSVLPSEEYNDNVDKETFEVCNYFNDEKFAQQVTLHELLNRKLMKFSYENGWSESCWKYGDEDKACIYKNHNKTQKTRYGVHMFSYFHWNCIYFISKEIAQRAIDEIILPFEQEYPEFRW